MRIVKKRILYLFGVLILFYYQPVLLFAQTPKYSNEFLAIGVGARALGMSNACVANVSDATSGYWNPAGLTLIKANRQLAIMHSEYFAGIAKYDFGSLAAKIDNTSTIGVTVIRFGVDDIPDTSELIDSEGNINYDRVKSFSAADYGFIFSYGRKSKKEGLRYGANAKIIHRKVGPFGKAWGFGLDAGLQYDLGKWNFGIMVKDITSTFNAWSYSLTDEFIEVLTLTDNEIPGNSLEITVPKILLGVARKFKFSKKFSGMAEIDFDISTDGMRNVLIKSDPFSIDPHMGIEAGYGNFVFLRFGVGNFQQETDLDNTKSWTFQPNFGVGIKIKKTLSLDYALTDIGNSSIALYSNIFSLKFNINPKGNKIK